MKPRSIYLIVTPLICIAFVSCQKEISFEGSNDTRDSLSVIPDPVPVATPIIQGVNTWQFVDSDNNSLHHGIIDTVTTEFDVRSLWNYLKIVGWPGDLNAINKDTMFLIALFLPNPVIEPGTYAMNSGVGGDHIFGYGNNTIVPPYGSNQNFCYYLASPTIAPDFIVKIISFDPQQRLLKGSFDGKLRRKANISDYGVTLHTVTGSFYLRLN